jgi:acyl carrier protein
MAAWVKKPKVKDPHPSAPLDRQTVENKLKAFVAAKSKLIAASDIDTSMKIFSSGLLDSLTYIDLVLFIDQEFKIKLSNVNIDSMDSIAEILETVMRQSDGSR